MKKKTKTWGMGCFFGPLTVLLLGALLCPPLPGDREIPLSLRPSEWRERVFLEGTGEPAAGPRAAVFAFSRDPDRGETFSIGPWNHGAWAARLERRRVIPAPTARLRGYYRSRQLLPFQGCVTVFFLGKGSVLARRSYSLAPSPAWRPFEIDVRTPPRGCDSLRLAFGLQDKTRGRIEFNALSVRLGGEAPFSAQPPPQPRRSWPERPFTGGRRYRLAKAGDSHWLVTPEGRPFYSIATVGPGDDLPDSPVTPAAEWTELLESAGFNSLAAWTPLRPWMRRNERQRQGDRRPLPLFTALSSGALKGSFDRLTDSRGKRGTPGHEFPDPFDPDFIEAYRREVLDRHRLLGDKDWFIGWFADNELDHDDLHRKVYSRHCSRAFREFLESRHRSIARLNRAWGSRYRSFEELILSRPDPLGAKGAMEEDFRLFSREIVRQYVSLTIRVIRSVDPERPIFSNRFSAGGMSAVDACLDLYAPYDGIAVNLYPQNQRAGLSDNERAFLRFFHQRNGQPVILSEWSVAALDSGLYQGPPDRLDWSWNEALASQAQRAGQAAYLAAEFYNLPFLVGAHWFSWKDMAGKRSANRGLFRVDGRPWRELLQELGAVQRRLGSN